MLVWSLLIVVAVVVIAVWYHNRFVALRNRCKESWANVDTELRRRHDLIPNLVQAVQGYAAHERSVMEEVARTRTALTRAQQHPTGSREGRLAIALDRLLAVAERYPDLRASTNFLELQQELAITEDRIQAARRFYNGNVRAHRDLTRTFPGNLFAALYRERPVAYFKLERLHMRRPPVVR